jgi:hypothetical protein
MHDHSPVQDGLPHMPGGQPFTPVPSGSNNMRGGRRPTIDSVVIGRAADEATGFDKESPNRSIKMTVTPMGPNTDFKYRKRIFLTFLSLKAVYLISQLAIRESGVWLDETARNYTCALLLHAANENKRAGQDIKCILDARHDTATVVWDIMCERLDGRSFARSIMSLLDNVMFRQRPYQSLTEYVHFMHQPFDDYNETCEMIDGSHVIHPHNLQLVVVRVICSTGHFG